MVIGITMVNVELGKEKDVYNEIKKIENVREVIHIFGEFDFIVIIKADDLSELNRTVDRIRSLKGVVKTQTVIGAEI